MQEPFEIDADRAFESDVRKFLVADKRVLESFESTLRTDPSLASFLNFQDGLVNYITRLPPSPDTWIYLNTLYLYRILYLLKASNLDNPDIAGGLSFLGELILNLKAKLPPNFLDKAAELYNLVLSLSERLDDEALREFKTLLISLKASSDSIAETLVVLDKPLTGIKPTLDRVEARLNTFDPAELAEILAFLARLSAQIEAVPQAVYEELKEHVSEFSLPVANAVADKIVGESYYKWQGTNSFYPTIVFIFREVEEKTYRKRVQLKMRLPEIPEGQGDEVIQRIKSKISEIPRENRHFRHGTIRGNYVAPDRRYKTTVFGETEDAIRGVLDFACHVTAQEFDRNSLSFTTGPRRVSITRKTEPMGGVGPQYDAYHMTFVSELYRITILIHGLQKPIVIYDEGDLLP